MKGHIFILLEDFVSEVASDALLYDALDACSFDTSQGFVRTENYPDEHLVELVGMVVDKMGISLSQAHFGFGQWLYPKLTSLLPSHFTQHPHPAHVLQKLDFLHQIELKKLYPDAQPPAFQYIPTSEYSAELIYTSPRKLFDLVKGVLAGMSTYYQVEITVEMQAHWRGDENCARYLLTYSKQCQLQPE
ncbi:heme NO-binding domain-containing protein [Pseudoalteromonas sp. SMS1]|uniref:heme NO-binding domain-containing protein n=1 Tax=Pseudoalteromonas sp. SMS1 TaxID=2908894 RepID=UPI001F2DB0C7|nr:heme NO-binding domain-containing protein [Pseudoalteromonas sp. SMS1]MCF2856162.1 heme NO-binding domain-containing protein [Pseudoalteromonas sp. SMS1]